MIHHHRHHHHQHRHHHHQHTTLSPTAKAVILSSSRRLNERHYSGQHYSRVTNAGTARSTAEDNIDRPCWLIIAGVILFGLALFFLVPYEIAASAGLNFFSLY